MKKLIDIFNKYRCKINKYWFAFIVFFIITFFIGDSTLQNRYVYDLKINQLEKDIELYRKQKEENLEKLKALHSDNESLEKFAREQFQMTKPDEELFIITE